MNEKIVLVRAISWNEGKNEEKMRKILSERNSIYNLENMTNAFR